MAEIYQDIDIFGDETPSGAPKEYFDKDAIKNALTMWLMVNRGEYLYEPQLGGILDTHTFKNLTNDSLSKLKFSVENDFKIYFGDLVNVRQLSIVPNKKLRYTEVIITYEDLINGGINEINIYPRQYTKEASTTYEEITLTEESLYNYVRIKKINMQGQKLVYNTRESTWVWGNNIKFINLEFSDSYFEKILEYINVL